MTSLVDERSLKSSLRGNDARIQQKKKTEKGLVGTPQKVKQATSERDPTSAQKRSKRKKKKTRKGRGRGKREGEYILSNCGVEGFRKDYPFWTRSPESGS